MLNHALRYARLGLSVIPLKPRDKVPSIPSWKEYQNRCATETEIRAWWSAAPNANIGIVTGKVSGIVIADLDGLEALSSASRMGLKSAVVSLTGRGRHLWYRYIPINNSASKIAEGIDIRGDGGYVVAPPSVHPNGKRYRWLNNGVVSAKLENRLIAFPQGLCTANVVPNCSTNIKPDSWISDALEDMKNGHIHNNLVSVLGKFRSHNFSELDTIKLLKPYAYDNGRPFEGLEAKVREIWGRYEPGASARPVQRNAYTESFDNGLIIHSPTNPDSIKQYEQLRMESNGGQTSPSLATGYQKLDQMLKGGLKSSRLFTLAARTGVGKTNWILGVTKYLCMDGKRVLFFSTEMPYAQIWERYIKALDTPADFTKHQFYVCDSFAPNLERVEEAIKEIKPDVFMFDHINHVSEEQRELGAFMQGLNFLRRKYDIAGIVTAQLNRQADWVDIKTGEKVTPRMSMIKGSGTIEQASSRVLLLSEKRITEECTEIVGNLDKNDNGPKGLLHFGLYANPYRMVQL